MHPATRCERGGWRIGIENATALAGIRAVSMHASIAHVKGSTAAKLRGCQRSHSACLISRETSIRARHRVRGLAPQLEHHRLDASNRCSALEGVKRTAARRDQDIICETHVACLFWEVRSRRACRAVTV